MVTSHVYDDGEITDGRVRVHTGVISSFNTVLLGLTYSHVVGRRIGRVHPGIIVWRHHHKRADDLTLSAQSSHCSQVVFSHAFRNQPSLLRRLLRSPLYHQQTAFPQLVNTDFTVKTLNTFFENLEVSRITRSFSVVKYQPLTADCKLKQTSVRLNLPSTPEMFGNSTDSRLLCQHSVPILFFYAMVLFVPFSYTLVPLKQY